MTQTTTEKRHKLDQLMLIDLDNAKQPDTFYKAGQLRVDLDLLDQKDSKNIEKIVEAYKSHTVDRMQTAIKKTRGR